LVQDNEDSRENEAPPRASRQEVMEDEGYEPAIRPPSSGRGGGFKIGGSGGSGGGPSLITVCIIALVAALVVFVGMGAIGGGGTYVVKKDFTTNLASIAESISALDNKVNTADSTARLAKDTAEMMSGKLDDLQKADKDFVTSKTLDDKLKGYLTTGSLPSLSDYAKKTDITGFVSQEAYDAKIKELQDQIALLKTAPGGTTITTGQVTVALDPVSSAQFNGAYPATIKLNVNNDTGKYQYVNFFASLTSVTTPSFAVSDVTATMTMMDYVATIVPATGNTFQILLTPEGKILVPPGITSCYFLITIEPLKAAVWEFSISNVTASVNP
jgi:hypothetical protein